MVVRLIGKINSDPVIFERKAGDRWEAIIPGVSSGVYVVELSAYDEAGNMAYISRFLLNIDLTALCMKVRLFDIGRKEAEKDFFANVKIREFQISEKHIKCAVSVQKKSDFFCKIRVGEPCDCF